MPPAITAMLLPPNPVWRSYLGGRVLRRFRSLPDADDNHFPEDWLASTVQARNAEHATRPFEGLSPVSNNGSTVLLPDLLRQDPNFWFGPSQLPAVHGQNLGVLWKLLDSSVRLQFQAHPSASFARKHLNSNAGKTECWYILSTRGEACVYLGFQHPPPRDAWAAMIREQRVDQMTACFEKIPVKPGECYVIPAGTPHAIGEGVFMVELMEPTDWVVRCETVNAGLALSPEACFMGLGLQGCLDVFDYSPYSVEQVRKLFQQHPRLISQNASCHEEEIIGSDWHDFFRLHRLRGNGSAQWPGKELMLALIVRGQGELLTSGNHCPATEGQTWLLPGAAENWQWRTQSQDWELLLLKLPLPAN
jgi:mannose-6-phosphate isomerase